MMDAVQEEMRRKSDTVVWKKAGLPLEGPYNLYT
jgi:hypothetical protein